MIFMTESCLFLNSVLPDSVNILITFCTVDDGILSFHNFASRSIILKCMQIAERLLIFTSEPL